ncbi:hypothetical protein, partial [Longimicrobium sp.]|uniref:hypothetical protein n=1 Tax=Longimicrobium sp. TaxID=2029185 RepID=UPI002F944E15
EPAIAQHLCGVGERGGFGMGRIDGHQHGPAPKNAPPPSRGRLPNRSMSAGPKRMSTCLPGGTRVA